MTGPRDSAEKTPSRLDIYRAITAATVKILCQDKAQEEIDAVVWKSNIVMDGYLTTVNPLDTAVRLLRRHFKENPTVADDDIIRLTQPLNNAIVQQGANFKLQLECQFPRGFVQGYGKWQAKEKSGIEWFDIGPITLIREVSQNPFPVSGQDSIIGGTAKAHVFIGHFLLRCVVVDEQQAILYVSNTREIVVPAQTGSAPDEHQANEDAA